VPEQGHGAGDASPSTGFVVPLRRLTAVVALLATLGGLVIALPALRHQFVLAFTRQPVDYSVLALADPSVDRTCSSIRSGQGLVFRLTNHEGHATTFGYDVALRPSQGSLLVRSGSLTVAAGATATERVPLVGPASRTVADVDVTLLGLPQRLILHCTYRVAAAPVPPAAPSIPPSSSATQSPTASLSSASPSTSPSPSIARTASDSMVSAAGPGAGTTGSRR
jgi:hypothetical protein